MSTYAKFGHKDFLDACGYKGEITAVRLKVEEHCCPVKTRTESVG